MAKDGRIRVLRIIARMNIGGPAYHVSLLSGRLDHTRYETLLVTGEVGPGEASFAELADRYGANLMRLRTLGPEIRPSSDIRTLLSLARLVRSFKPDIVHTHTAKAGTLGRLAAVLAMPSRPVLVHTFHGHVLEDFFGPVASGIYTSVETFLARFTDCLVCVSNAVADDLIRLGVGPRHKFRVVPLGLDLERFLSLDEERRTRFRASVGITSDVVMCVFSGRLVGSKRIDFMLQAFARARRQGARAQLVIAGDGPERHRLQVLSQSLGISGQVKFLGYRKDIEDIVAGCDVAVLTSRSEGTPLFLIEASAAARPTVATAVDGVPDIVTPQTGILVDPDDAPSFADAIALLASDEKLRARLGGLARAHVRYRFSSTRLLADIDRLYRELLANRRAPPCVPRKDPYRLSSCD